MTTWKRSVGWTWIFAASTGLGKAVGFNVGGPHGPGLIVSHHGRARLRSDHWQLWFRQINSQTGYARKHLQCTPHPTLMHTLFIHHTWQQESKINYFFFVLFELPIHWSVGSCSYLSDNKLGEKEVWFFCFIVSIRQSCWLNKKYFKCKYNKISHKYYTFRILFWPFVQGTAIAPNNT